MSGPVAYQFHVALRHVSPKIWRRVQLRIDDSLADLHRVIQTVMGWSDEFQHRFRIRNHCLGASRAGGLLYCGDPVELKLEQFRFRLYERFTYEYNFFDAWILDVRFDGAYPLDSRRRYPWCLAGARRAPLEDSGGPEAYLEREYYRPRSPTRTRWLDRQLRQLAQLLEEPALDTNTFRARARQILRERRPPEFDCRAVNEELVRLTAEGTSLRREVADGDPDPVDHRW